MTGSLYTQDEGQANNVVPSTSQPREACGRRGSLGKSIGYVLGVIIGSVYYYPQFPAKESEGKKVYLMVAQGHTNFK